MPHKMVFASSNTGKINEISAIFAEKSIDIIPQAFFNVPDIEETGLTFVENAILKARHCCKHTGLPSIADDSGLVIDALDGRPGIHSARYAGKNSSSEEKIAKILIEMSEVLAPQRTARFFSVIVFMRNHDDPAPIIGEGIWEGSILTEPHGIHGFGYDPIFWVPEHRCAAAELNPAVKNQISHRAQALKRLFKRLGAVDNSLCCGKNP